MKILFTSVGRRVELVQSFKNAAKELSIDLDVIGADMSKSAPALFFCDEKKIVPSITNPNYIEQLIDICKKESVDCLIPTIDTELIILAKYKNIFSTLGTIVLISDLDKIKICRDKKRTADYFCSLGLKSPKAVDDIEEYNYGFPAFIKPKNGSSSIDTYKANNGEDLKLYAKKIGNYIIQPFIFGTEYTVDIFCDYSGYPIYITPRERMAVRAGEVLKTRICQDDKIIEEIQILVEDFKPCGQITVQLIRDDKTGEDYYIEINPRFGGGAPLSIKAGADSAKALLRLLQGEKLTYIEKAALDGAVYSRFDQSVCVSEGN